MPIVLCFILTFWAPHKYCYSFNACMIPIILLIELSVYTELNLACAYLLNIPMISLKDSAVIKAT